ncbi:hypothetical protein [Paraferrimonas sp. SM1919]|uniref:hypothetical protein n=1 Tax=Paraferrimonas sp. SM1919 TaxID=2662263 RepID=UPI0013D31379|nr:hypothetical protein [Paraferrimonas sp. SM1919]
MAGLIHDFAKIKSYNQDYEFTDLAKRVNHEALTLEVCAHSFKFLDTANAEAANDLRVCICFNHHYAYQSHNRIIEALKIADNL